MLPTFEGEIKKLLDKAASTFHRDNVNSFFAEHSQLTTYLRR